MPDTPAAWSPALLVEGRVHAWRAHWLALARQALTRSPHPLAARRAVKQGFVLTGRQAYDDGVSSPAVRSLLRRGIWSVPRRGVLCVLAPGQADSVAIATTAAVLARPGCMPVAASAAVVHGLPLFAPPHRPLLSTTAGRASGGHPGVVVRIGSYAADELDGWFGVRLPTIARTVIDVACDDRRDGLIAADAALAEDLVTCQELVDAAASLTRRRPGARAARFVAEFADHRAESPLESMTRLLLHDHGIPLPEPQAWVGTAGGTYRVDGLWRERRVVLEVDGMLKYGDRRSLVREKRRQEHLERAGYRVVRLTWQDVVGDPAGTAARIRWALGMGGTVLGQR